MIPTSSFTYREAATPAKWTMDDPDLPSPFIRRASTAPTAVVAAERERRPLVPVSHDNTRTAAATAPLRLAGKTTVPRSKSGTLHQQVLKTNAGRASGEGTTGSAVSTKFRFGAGR
jgi:NIMA (never in mitosis gene a)-related kinase